VLRQNPPLKDLLQKMPLGKLSFFTYISSQKGRANQQKQLRNNAFHVKTSQSAKNWHHPAKNKNWPKMLYTPFLHKSLQLFLVYTTQTVNN